MRITLTIPNVSTNRLYTNHRYTGRRILTRHARDTKTAWAWEAKDQYREEPFDDYIDVEIEMYFTNRRRRDVDNIKALLDAMTGILWKDDSLIVDLRVRKFFRKDPDADDPRIVITANYTDHET